MNGTIFYCLIIALSFVVGCRDPKDGDLEKAIKDLEQDIDHFGKTMETDIVNPGIPSKGLTERINAIPDETAQKKLRERLADYVYSIDLTKVPRDKYSRRGEFKGFVRDFTDSGMFSKRALSFLEIWDLRFRYLGWHRRELEKIRAKRPYPDGVSRWISPSGRIDWKFERSKHKEVLDYQLWLDSYDSLAKLFEQTLGWWETKLLETERVYVNASELAEVTARFENFVGRKVRTLRQCDDDFYADRRCLYPHYVAMPGGIKEAWSKVEAENMTKASPNSD